MSDLGDMIRKPMLSEPQPKMPLEKLSNDDLGRLLESEPECTPEIGRLAAEAIRRLRLIDDRFMDRLR